MEKLIRSYGRKCSRGLSEAKKNNLVELFEIYGIEETRIEQKITELSRDFNEIVLEIGFGNGEHLINNAKVNVDIGFIGCEVFVNGVASTLKNIAAVQLKNVRIFRDDVRILLNKLPDAFLRYIYVLFPDPWPKMRHHKRRLLSENFIKTLLQKIRSDGHLFIVTDCRDYMIEILEHLQKISHEHHVQYNANLDELAQRPEDFLGTKYEKKALEKKVTCYYLKIHK